MFFLVSLPETYYICCRKYSRIDWIGKLIKLLWNTETSFVSQWRATPFGVTFESVDYKEDERSNHVIRSFITSSVRLFYKRNGNLGWLPFLFLFNAVSPTECTHGFIASKVTFMRPKVTSVRPNLSVGCGNGTGVLAVLAILARVFHSDCFSFALR